MKKLTSLSLALLVSLGLSILATLPAWAAGGEVHWGYEGTEGPEHWGDLSPNFKLCGSGKEQTPINVPSTAPVNPADITFNYGTSTDNVLNNGHTVQVNYDSGSSITVGGQTYDLLQLHFHAPSEHAVDGSHTPMELHLVHQADDGQLAVVGVMLKEGLENRNYDAVLDHLPMGKQDATVVAGVSVVASDLLPADKSYYRYNGSLTTPPCSEGVQWLLMANPVQISKTQIAKFTQIFSDDARPLQPMNARRFYLTSGSSRSEAAPAAGTTMPSVLPKTGGEELPWGLLLLAIGFLMTGAGVWRMKQTAGQRLS